MLDAALVRSMLFVPATRPERFAKAAASGADAVIVDLEDAVPLPEKGAARAAAVAHLVRAGATPLRCIRTNGLRTPDGLRDVLALVDAGAVPDLVVVPKVESADELDVLDGVLDGRHRATRFVP